MCIHHLVNKRLLALMRKLDEAGFCGYMTYIASDTLGIMIGNPDAIWCIDVTEYLVPVKSNEMKCISTELSVLIEVRGEERYYTVQDADEAFDIIKDFFEKGKVPQ